MFKVPGQSVTGINQFWFNIGLAAFGTSHFIGTGYIISGNYYVSTGLISARWACVEDNFVKPAVPQTELRIDKLNELGLYYGKIFKTNLIYVSGSLGISYTWGKKCQFLNRYDYNYPGIPVNFHLYFIPVPVFGIGIEWNSNINVKQTTHEVFICLQIGLLK